MQKVFWNLRKKPESTEGEQFRRRMGAVVDPGVFKVTLVFDGKEVATKKIKNCPGSCVE